VLSKINNIIIIIIIVVVVVVVVIIIIIIIIIAHLRVYKGIFCARFGKLPDAKFCLFYYEREIHLDFVHTSVTFQSPETPMIYSGRASRGMLMFYSWVILYSY
jgi:hypothetical protein